MIPDPEYAEGVMACLTIIYANQGHTDDVYREVAEQAMKYEHLVRFAKVRNLFNCTGLAEYDKTRAVA